MILEEYITAKWAYYTKLAYYDIIDNIQQYHKSNDLLQSSPLPQE